MTWKRLNEKQRTLLRYAPFDASRFHDLMFVDRQALYREHHTTIDPRSALPVRTHGSVWLDPFDPQDRKLIPDPPFRASSRTPRRRRGSGESRYVVRAVHPDDVDPLSPAPSGDGSFNKPKMEPIFEPQHNMKAIGKELALLEDHLFQPTRRCNDCIRKHLVRAEAFGEEGISLDRTGSIVPLFTQYLDEIRGLQGQAFGGEVDRHQLGQVVRDLRKRVCKVAYGSSLAQAEEDRADRVPQKAIDAAVDDLASEWLGESGVTGVVDDYWRDGPVIVVSTVTGRAPRRLPKRFKGIRVVVVKGQHGLESRRSGGTGQFGAVALPGVAFRAGQDVVYAYRPKGDAGPIEGWYPGRVLSVGETAGEYKVEQIPQDGYVAVESPDGASRYWAYESETTPRSLARPISAEFASRGKIVRYMPDGTKGSIPLTSARLAMIDVIQSVLERELAQVVPSEEVRADVIRAAVFNSAYESKLDPTLDTKKTMPASGEDSVGLFQLNVRGAGAGMSQEERENPILNTARIAAEFKQRLGETAPFGVVSLEDARRKLGVGTLGELAARASSGDRPTVGEWTAAWTIQVERPKHAAVDARIRKQAADDDYPTVGRVVQPASSTGRSRIYELGIDTDQRERNAFGSRMSTRSDAGVVEMEATALFDEETAAKAAGEGTQAFRSGALRASAGWLALGQAIGDPWPIARSVALAMIGGDQAAADVGLRLLVERYLGTPYGRAAEAELRRPVAIMQPVRVLSSPQHDMRSVAAGAALAGAVLLGGLVAIASRRV